MAGAASLAGPRRAGTRPPVMRAPGPDDVAGLKRALGLDPAAAFQIAGVMSSEDEVRASPRRRSAIYVCTD